MITTPEEFIKLQKSVVGQRNIDFAQLQRLGLQEIKQTKQIPESKVIQANAAENRNNQ
jgi:hypothetical protein